MFTLLSKVGEGELLTISWTLYFSVGKKKKVYIPKLLYFYLLLFFAGTFSNVYLAKMNRLPDELCALKHIIPTSGPGRVENELKCLQDIGYMLLQDWFMT